KCERKLFTYFCYVFEAYQNLFLLVHIKSLVVPHDWYDVSITALSHSMDTLICITRVETEGFQSLVRFFHKHRSLCILLLVN
ncbi:MAG: hypothetical protein QOK61_08495, partial [Nitrososphaeraceae archaeon]|nr:hypothetical protein [Nitrososphaeraceae archaeon]